jgi:photosystem II stability/assembly factor-like uncharacterized protein
MTQLKKEVALFVQPDPTEGLGLLTCHGVGRWAPPVAATTINYCPGTQYGRFTPRSLTRGEQGVGTLALNSILDSVYNYILELNCPAEWRVNWGCRGDRFVTANYRFGLALLGGEFSGREIVEAGAFEPEDAGDVEVTGELSALEFAYIKKIAGSRQAVTSTQGVNDLAFLPEICADDCNDYVALGDMGYAVLDTDYLGVYGDTVLFTADGGATWTVTATSPFTVLGRNATSVVVIITSDDHRVIVGGGAMPATFPEVSYSDDRGVTWTNVQVATNGGVGINHLFRDELGRVWAAADDGYIYVSADQGVTWTTSENAQETAQDINETVMFDESVGYAVADVSTILKTEDGSSWDALANPPTAGAINYVTVTVNRFGHVFVGTSDARTFRSTDEGATAAGWEEIDDRVVGSINRIRFDPEHRYIGYFIWDDAGPIGQLWRSEDGGNTWAPETTPANAGLDALFVNDPNMLYIGGEPVAATSFIAKYIRQA